MSDDYKAGVQAVYDWFQMRAANHWHARPESNAECVRENKVCLEWIEDARTDVLEQEPNQAAIDMIAPD